MPDNENSLIFVATRNNTFFEISNHLGNVHLVLSDYRSITGDGSGTITGYHSSVLSASEYYPFGMLLVEGEYDSELYRYGFNTMEKDDEIKGLGNSYDFGARMYDPRLGRWMAIDPLYTKYPDLSPYAFVGNMPIIAIDPDGKDIWISNSFQKSDYAPVMQVLTSNSVFIMYAEVFDVKTQQPFDWIIHYKEIDKRIVTCADEYFYTAYTSPLPNNEDYGGFSYGASSETFINSEQPYDKPVNEVAMATTLLHEVIHAFLYNQTATGGSWVSDHHREMADNHRDKIILGIKQYVDYQGITNISNEEIEILSWSGLTETNAFYKEYDTEEKRNLFWEKLEVIQTKELEYDEQ